ncbi:MAG: hypothetical protein COV67_08300 [Nitrospinae bacterium CG11_big_fil_rev_8_21_14_0_20_56_8]|nr:MAG: hypothetical protein COV67_08300 [Nitrospinae bacterium CG11_big_fil_rev_8_21_14_0_20_56_8]
MRSIRMSTRLLPLRVGVFHMLARFTARFQADNFFSPTGLSPVCPEFSVLMTALTQEPGMLRAAEPNT